MDNLLWLQFLINGRGAKDTEKREMIEFTKIRLKLFPKSFFERIATAKRLAEKLIPVRVASPKEKGRTQREERNA